MTEFEDFPPYIWSELENHFVVGMLMRCVYNDDGSECSYHDDDLSMIISITTTEYNELYTKIDPGVLPIRITIKNWRTRKSFSRSVFFDSKIDNIVNYVYSMVYNEGGDNKDILNEWRELKKPEIRDIKLGKLGI